MNTLWFRTLDCSSVRPWKSVRGEQFGNSYDVSPVARELKQLYARCFSVDSSLEVNLIACVQQPNDFDCGVFATAFLFEWTAASVHTSLAVRFDLSKMRPHLIICLEAKRVIAFPSLPTTRWGINAQTWDRLRFRCEETHVLNRTVS